ncbi:MAG TPA: hypothetical protein VLC28_04770, partial [Flavitalea sp.]|nr:hypothetical protein [Flavitalea sp.]
MQPGKLLLCSSLLLCFSFTASSQLIKKIKQKVENATDKMIDKKINEKIGGGTSNTGPGQPGANESSRAGGSGRNSNSTGEGLVTVPP